MAHDTTPATKAGLIILSKQVGRTQSALSDWAHESTELATGDEPENSY